MSKLSSSFGVICRFKQVTLIVLAGALALLSACGGGGSSSSAPIPASISVQAASTSAVAGTAATFSVTAVGDGLNYQWQRSTDNALTWADIAGATAASFTIAAVDASLNGYQFRVTVTGTAGSVTSSAATLTVTAAPAAPVITVQPADQSVTAGVAVAFSVTATGTSLAYQWQSSPDGTTWTSVSGASSATLTLNAVAVTDTGKQFRAVVSNGSGTVNSATARLTVAAAAAPPAIATQPSPASVVAPATATFTVVATGTPAPTYQWQISTDGGLTYSNIAAATGTSYTTGATAVADSGMLFRVQVSNSAGSVTSNGALLSVGPAAMAPVITAEPASTSAIVGAPATFTVLATGVPSPTYQWQLSTDGGATFANINGAKSSNYVTSATVIGDSGKLFQAVVTNSAGSVTSSVAMLTVGNSSLGGYPDGVVLNGSGNLYVSTDVGFSGIQEVNTTTGTVVHIAGSTFGGAVDGTGSAARFKSPEGISLDASGNLYIADNTANLIRKMAPGAVVTTLAGSGTMGSADGTGAAASFNLPSGVAAAVNGTVYVADTSIGDIRVISPAGVVSTLVPSGSGINSPDGIAVDANGYLYVADGNAIKVVSPLGAVSTLVLVTVSGLTLDSSGNIYATGDDNVFEVSPQGVVTIIAGSSGVAGFVDGTGTAARFSGPEGIARDSSGNLYVADLLNSAIRKITPTGVVTTLAH